MATSVPSFLELFYLLWDYQNLDEHTHPYEDILLPWQSQALGALDVLRVYGNIEARHWRPDQPKIVALEVLPTGWPHDSR
jgi:hypothetical protein